MDTTVITVEEADYGVGTSDRVTFVDSKYVIDDAGTLHVHRSDNTGNVGSFPRGSWRAVIRGGIASTAGLTKVDR